MTRIEILKRIDLLRDVFAYTLLHTRLLSISQRICLTQERAAWLEVLEWFDQEQMIPKYVLPNHLEVKVQIIHKKIIETNWVKPKYEPLF